MASLRDRIEALRDRLFGAWQMLAAICESDAQTDPLGASADRIKARDRAAEGYRMANSILAAEPSDAGLREYEWLHFRATQLRIVLQTLYDATPDCEGGELGEACMMARKTLRAIPQAALRSGGDGWRPVEKGKLPDRDSLYEVRAPLREAEVERKKAVALFDALEEKCQILRNIQALPRYSWNEADGPRGPFIRAEDLDAALTAQESAKPNVEPEPPKEKR